MRVMYTLYDANNEYLQILKGIFSQFLLTPRSTCISYICMQVMYKIQNSFNDADVVFAQ